MPGRLYENCQKDLGEQDRELPKNGQDAPAPESALASDSTNLFGQGRVKKETSRLLCGPRADNALRLYYCGSEICSPGHAFGPAVRTHYLIHFILDGKGTYLRGEERYSLKKGDAFLILPGETTRYMADEADPWVYTWIAFDGEDAEMLLQHCGLSERNVVYHSGGSAQARRLSEKIKSFESSFHDWNQNVLEITGKLYLIFACMYPEQTEPQTAPAKGREGTYVPDGLERYYSQAAVYLECNFSYPVKVEQLARQIGVSRTYLYKAFVRCCGKSVQQYLLDLRLEEASRLLRTTSRSITDIAYSCGFKDSPSFCRHFKRAYGCPPLVYRKREESRSDKY